MPTVGIAAVRARVVVRAQPPIALVAGARDDDIEGFGKCHSVMVPVWAAVEQKKSAIGEPADTAL